DYDANDRLAAMTYLHKHAAKGQVVTGLLYVDPDSEDLHTHLDTVETPLNTLEAKDLCPGTSALDKINDRLRELWGAKAAHAPHPEEQADPASPRMQAPVPPHGSRRAPHHEVVSAATLPRQGSAGVRNTLSAMYRLW